MSNFYERTTDVVTIILLLSPLAALVYCIARLWHYPDVGIFLWTVIMMLSLVFVVRAWLFGLRSERDDEFAVRRRSPRSNRPLQTDR